MITVAIIDDKEFARGWLRLYIKAEASDAMVLVREAASVRQLIDTSTVVPDVVVLDAFLGEGTKLTDNIQRLNAWGTKVVVFSEKEFSAMLRKTAFDQYARGFVHKEDGFEELRKAIETAATGKVYMTTELTKALLSANVLTKKQEEVAAGLVAGMTNAEIASQMGIREDGVKDHIKKIREKYRSAGRPIVDRADLREALEVEGY